VVVVSFFLVAAIASVVLWSVGEETPEPTGTVTTLRQ
jgi:hypothetical protein